MLVAVNVLVTMTSLPNNGVRSRAVVQVSKIVARTVRFPPTQTIVNNGNWVEYHPLAAVGDDSPIEFKINGNGEDYIDLANTMIYVQR